MLDRKSIFGRLKMSCKRICLFVSFLVLLEMHSSWFDSLNFFFLDRPVLALYDIDTLKVEENKKEQKLQEIVSNQGPPDGTVIISVETEEMEQELVEAIVQFFSDVGEIVLVRCELF